MKTFKVKTKFDVNKDLTKFRWIHYKKFIIKFKEAPFVDKVSLIWTRGFFDVYLLEYVVKTYNKSFLYFFDHELMYSEQKKFGFKRFLSLLELWDILDEELFLFNAKFDINKIYMLNSDVFDSLIVLENSDLIYQRDYKLLLWGPLELVYHNLYSVVWISKKASVYKFSVVYQLFHYLSVNFRGFYGFQEIYNTISKEFYVLNYFIFYNFYYKYKSGLYIYYSSFMNKTSILWIDVFRSVIQLVFSRFLFLLQYFISYFRYSLKLLLYFITTNMLKYMYI